MPTRLERPAIVLPDPVAHPTAFSRHPGCAWWNCIRMARAQASRSKLDEESRKILANHLAELKAAPASVFVSVGSRHLDFHWTGNSRARRFYRYAWSEDGSSGHNNSSGANGSAPKSRAARGKWTAQQRRELLEACMVKFPQSTTGSNICEPRLRGPPREADSCAYQSGDLLADSPREYCP
jgi:hypothetical protein